MRGMDWYGRFFKAAVWFEILCLSGSLRCELLIGEGIRGDCGV